MLDRAELVRAMIKCGPNPNSLANLLGRPSLEMREALYELSLKDGLTVFPAVYSEGLGLRKVFMILENAKVKYETARGLLHPVMSVFRGDVEERLFSAIVFADGQLEQEIRRLIGFLEPSFSFIDEVIDTRKFVRDPTCYNFEAHRWVCQDKVEMRQGRKLSSPDQVDVWAVTQVQSNPSLNLEVLPHRWHVRKVLTGFMYVLGKTSLVVQALTKEDLSYVIPEIIWTARVGDIYVSEMHVDNRGLEKAMEKLRPNALKIIVSPKSPKFALGYTIPFEIFRDRTWKYPTLKVQART